jgi:serine acetyltransferase
VGANSVVTHDVAPSTLVVGAPARVVRTFRESPQTTAEVIVQDGFEAKSPADTQRDG